MMTLYDLSMQVRSLMKEKKFAHALSLFKHEKVNYEQAQIASNGYLIADLMSCLRHNGQAHFAFILLEGYGIELNQDAHANILSAYGWILHRLLKQQHAEEDEDPPPFEAEDLPADDLEWDDVQDPDRKQLNDRLEAWLTIMRSDMEGFNYSVVSNVLKVFLKTEAKRQHADWDLIDRVTGLFDPATLSTECFRMKRVVRGVEKEVELASDREIWYASRSKALENLQQHSACEALCTEALGAFDRFHYGNEVWFARRMALARLHLGDLASARKGLEGLLRRKDEWFIRKEIAELDFREGLHEQALIHCKKALAGHGDLEYKVGLMLLTARVLNAVGHKDMSDKHYRLMQLVREEQGWRSAASLLSEMENLSASVLAVKNPGQLLRELKAFWVEGIPTVTKGRIKGRIDRILNDNEQGMDGFIRTEAGDNIYFREIRQAPIVAEIRKGREVSFELLPQKEGKFKAVRIRPV